VRVSRPLSAAAAVCALALVAACGAGDSSPKAADDSVVPSTNQPTTTSPGTTTTPPADIPLAAGQRFLTIGLPGGTYTPHADVGTDDYRCFLIDPKLTSKAFITGVQFQPGNAAVVHHAILFRVRPEQVSVAQHRDSAQPGPGWTCFAGTGVAEDSTDPVGALNTAPWLAAWAPGGHEQVSAKGVGVEVDAGTQIVLQVHYNLRAGKGPDSTHVRLRLSPASASLKPLTTMLLPAPVELPCASGQTGPLCDRAASMRDLAARVGPQAYATVAGLQLLCGGSLTAPKPSVTQSCDRKVQDSVVIRAAAGHMHLLGRAISIELDPGTPRARKILDITSWDFDNQSAHNLATPLRIGPGDTIRVTCTHDARLRDLVPELQDLPSRYVTWGEGTSDEMCLGILLVTKN
jgi:hypothetical protein